MIIVRASFVELISEVQRGVSLSASSRSITLQRNFIIVRFANFESQFRPIQNAARFILFSAVIRNAKHETRVFVEIKVLRNTRFNLELYSLFIIFKLENYCEILNYFFWFFIYLYMWLFDYISPYITIFRLEILWKISNLLLLKSRSHE